MGLKLVVIIDTDVPVSMASFHLRKFEQNSIGRLSMVKQFSIDVK